MAATVCKGWTLRQLPAPLIHRPPIRDGEPNAQLRADMEPRAHRQRTRGTARCERVPHRGIHNRVEARPFGRRNPA
jgi:hypothetical protein